MRTFGLIGLSLQHSFSKDYFSKKFLTENINAVYKNFEINSLTLLEEILLKENISGLNVTIPFKIQICNYLNDIDKTAQNIGSVNVIKIDKAQQLKGYNTDYIGFEQSIKKYITKEHNKALILGTGGSSKSVKYVFDKLNIDSNFVSNTNTKYLKYNDINKEIIDKHQIIVNTTPLGMYPNTNQSPSLPYQYLTNKNILFDLVYNPIETEFLKKGKRQGATTINGIEMLQIQAEESWKIWNNTL